MTMKRHLLRPLLTLLCAAGFLTAPAANPEPFVIPALKSWRGATGTWSPRSGTRIVAAADAEVRRIAGLLADDCRTLTDLGFDVAEGRPAKGDIVLALKADAALGEEGYAIRTTADRVTLTAPTPTGLYWATRTLLQMLEQTPEGIPCGEIRDWPDYAMRGLMIDCGRKHFPMPFLEAWVKILSYYKMNTLQVHLNDNGFKAYFDNDWSKTYAAFRLESETFPGLTARDGSYTKQEFRTFQRDAAARFVEIIPEIDAPAHTLAMAHYKPELGSEEYGMDHLDLKNPETLRFMDALWSEYLEGDDPVFVGPRVHIGTDEYSNRDPEVVELFRAFTDHCIRHVERYGKQAVVWGALTHAAGKTPVKSENVLMDVWYNGYAEPREMVRQGYRIVSVPDRYIYIVPAAGYYYDYLNTRYLWEQWTPADVGGERFEERDPVLEGGMFAVWNDHVGNGITTADVHDRLFPAAQTLATKMWTGAVAAETPFERFDSLRLGLSEAPGVNLAGAIGSGPGIVWSCDRVQPHDRTPYREAGYGYRVEFDLECAAEEPGTVLFRSPDAVFYLADPASGALGFARDGYLECFSWRPLPGERCRIGIECDNRATRLYVDGRLVEELGILTRWYDKEGKTKMHRVRTLHFPLAEAGDFRSGVTRFEIHRLK